jgi:hypothetical protein
MSLIHHRKSCTEVFLICLSTLAKMSNSFSCIFWPVVVVLRTVCSIHLSINSLHYLFFGVKVFKFPFFRLSFHS